MAVLTKAIRRELVTAPTIVIWVVDASLSMKAGRDELAEHIDVLHADASKQADADGSHELKSVVVSFGQQTHDVTPAPLGHQSKLNTLIREIESDESGTENVFTAVATAAATFKRFRSEKDKHNLVMVIVTDERGDDDEHLEAAVKLCSDAGIRVFCLGHAAPFGQVEGFVQFVFEDGFAQDFPVDRGPETTMPLYLDLSKWGNSREQISSGFGPFALSRLCATTGGKFVIVEDAAEHRFAADVMEKYKPDWQTSAQDMVKTLDRKRDVARIALLQAAHLTSVKQLQPPPLEYRADTDAAFRTAAPKAQRAVAVLDYRTNELTQLLKAGEKQRDSLDDPRWQASFDLAMGRALAMRTRTMLLNVRLAQMKSSPQPLKKAGNNTWILSASDDLGGVSTLQKLAAQASEYLQRVVDEHAGTPFAFVARLELKRGFGWSWTEAKREYPAEAAPPKRSSRVRRVGKL